VDKYFTQFEVPGLPKRINQGHGSSWQSRYGEAKKWERQIFLATLGKRPAKPLKKCTLKLTRFSSVAPDFDGLVYSFKPVVDALRKLKIIEDDSMAHIGRPEYVWEKAKPGAGRIKVEIKEVDEHL
jgi:Holliday junction resolvase RusA-like endonuclease